MNVEEFKKHLENNIIPFWNRLTDKEYGGFYGYVNGDGCIEKTSDKGCILNSRILWFYSAVYVQFGDEALLELARHAYDFMVNKFYDSQYGGVYWSVHYDGEIADNTKHTYNQAFAIYALAEYYRASKHRDALNMAYTLYRTVEDRCRDEDGYLEAFYRDFEPAKNDKLSENGVMAARTMNTLLHVLEAYTELYLVDSFYEVGDSIRMILRLFKEKVYNRDRKICEVFFDSKYHSLIDLESYGHDIETSWLIDRACCALGDVGYQREFLPITRGLAEAAYKNGIDQVARAMNDESKNGRVDRQKIWWVQAEAVTGFYNAYQKNPEHTEYLKISEDIWRYVCENMVDEYTGEWRESLSEDGRQDKDQALVHPWKCPYHNGRMCLEMIKRLSAA